MTPPNDDLLTPAEAAELLRVAVSTLVRWRRETRKTKRQHGPHWVQLGRNTVNYRRSAILAFIASREQGVQS